MSLDISSETEARLVARTREQGLSVDALLQRLVREAAGLKPNGEIRELLT